jgi:thiol-disulfide isomerase/thioredoxin
MKKMLVFLFLIVGSQLLAQELNQIVVDEKLNNDVLIGMCDRNAFESEVFAGDFNTGYSEYQPDATIIKQLKKMKKGLEIVIVMASWCGDSKEQVPRFYKILDEIDFKDSDLTLIAVDGEKTAGEVDISALGIERVPTFLFYKEGREIGKIVESPTGSSLERDMLLILTLNK